MEGLAEIITDFFNSIDPKRTWTVRFCCDARS
jgi:hypothetical protein